MNVPWDSAQLLAAMQQTTVRSWRWWRQLKWFVVLVAGITGVASGGYGLYELIGTPTGRTQTVVVLGLAAVGAVLWRVTRRWRMRIAPPLHPLTPPAPAWNAHTVLARAQVSRWQRAWRWLLHRSDRIAWILLAVVLLAAAVIVTVLSVFATYDALMSGVDVTDLIWIFGLLGPIASVLNGWQQWQQRRAQNRQRAQALSASVRNAITAWNMAWEQVRTWQTGWLAPGGAVSAVVVTVAASAAIVGVGNAFVVQTPAALLVTGRVVPLPPELLAAIGGTTSPAYLRSTIISACVDDVLRNQGASFDATCVQTIQQVDAACASFDGERMVLACAEAVITVIPELQPLVNP